MNPKNKKPVPKGNIFKLHEPVGISDQDIKKAKGRFPGITDIKKRSMLLALEKNIGIVTSAADALGIHRDTHYAWLKSDKDYKIAVANIENSGLDFAESKLYQNIANGDTTAIIFYLKTKGKKRGYIEKTLFGFDDSDDETEVSSTLDV